MNDNSTVDCPILLKFGTMVYYENDRRDVGRPPVTATFLVIIIICVLAMLCEAGDLFTNGRATVFLRTTGHRFATLVVNKSYRKHAVGRKTSVVAYVRQTIVNSHPGLVLTALVCQFVCIYLKST